MISCTFENGAITTTLRHVSVDSIALKDGKIFLVKRSEKLAEGGKWAFPGGFLSHGESIKDAAVREFTEETGWSASVHDCFSISTSPKRTNDLSNWQNISFTFILDVHEQVGKPDWESSEVKRFSLDACPPLDTFAFDHGEILQLYLHHDVSIQFPIIRW